MLVLTRRVDEQVTITVPPGFSGDITVMLVQVNDKRAGHAKLGIQAPTEVRVRRTELQHEDIGEPK